MKNKKSTRMGIEDEDNDERGHHGTALTIALSAAFFLVGITLLILFLCFYSKHLLRRQQRRRRRDLLYRITQIAPTNVNSAAESPNSGLDPVIIASLPRILYKQTDQFRQGGGEEVIECSVCLTTIVEGATIRVLPNCKHVFHVDCVDTWFCSNSTCPVCRAVVELEPMVHINDHELVQPTEPLVVEDDGEVSRDVNHELEKVGCSGLRIPSFSSMIVASRERSSRKNQSSDGSDSIEDVEKQ